MPTCLRGRLVDCVSVEENFMSHELKIGNKSVELIAITGVVAESSSSSSRAYSERVSNLMNGTYLHSELQNETNFFLQRDDGGELAVSLPAQIALRAGHKVTVIYGTCSDGESASAIAMFNDTLGSRYELPVDRLLLRLEIKHGRAPVSKFGCLTMLVLIAFMVFSAVLSAKHFLDWTLASPFFWMVLAGAFGVSVAGAYVIDPLINAGEAKRIQKAFHKAISDLKANPDLAHASSSTAAPTALKT